MAEAILSQVGGDRFHAYSAGSDPANAPMPEVIDKLRALGHDVSGLHCKSWNVFTGPDAPRMDFVITLCDTEDSQACPDFGDKVVTGVVVAARPCQVHRQASSARHCSTSFMPAFTAAS